MTTFPSCVPLTKVLQCLSSSWFQQGLQRTQVLLVVVLAVQMGREKAQVGTCIHQPLTQPCLSPTDACKYHIVKHIFSGGDQTFVLCSKYEVNQMKYLFKSSPLSQHSQHSFCFCSNLLKWKCCFGVHSALQTLPALTIVTGIYNFSDWKLPFFRGTSKPMGRRWFQFNWQGGQSSLFRLEVRGCFPPVALASAWLVCRAINHIHRDFVRQCCMEGYMLNWFSCFCLLFSFKKCLG